MSCIGSQREADSLECPLTLGLTSARTSPAAAPNSRTGSMAQVIWAVVHEAGLPGRDLLSRAWWADASRSNAILAAFAVEILAEVCPPQHQHPLDAICTALASLGAPPHAHRQGEHYERREPARPRPLLPTRRVPGRALAEEIWSRSATSGRSAAGSKAARRWSSMQCTDLVCVVA